MTTQFVTKYLDKKIDENENYLVCEFFDLRIRHNLSEEEIYKFLELSKIRLENLNYKVYFTGAEYTYKGQRKVVQDNEYMVAIKQKKSSNKKVT